MEWLWNKTCTPGSTHPSFDLLSELNSNPISTDLNSSEEQPGNDEIEEALQEEAFLEYAKDGEDTEDENVHAMIGEPKGGWNAENK